MDEILQNVYARLESSGALPSLGAGVVIAGGGSALKGLPALMSERLKMEVRYATIRKGIVAGGDTLIASNPEFATAIGLLAQGSQNCAYYLPPKPEPKPEPKPVVESQPKVEPEVKKPQPKEKSKGESVWKKMWGSVQQELFFDDDLENKKK